VRPGQSVTEVLALIDRRETAEPSRRGNGDGEEERADQRSARSSHHGQAQDEYGCRGEECRQREPVRALTRGKEEDDCHRTLQIVARRGRLALADGRWPMAVPRRTAGAKRRTANGQLPAPHRLPLIDDFAVSDDVIGVVHCGGQAGVIRDDADLRSNRKRT
jgi:hypothetical protein